MTSFRSFFLVLSFCFASGAQAESGKDIYTTNCVTCHGEKGDGNTTLGKAVHSANFNAGFKNNSQKFPNEKYIIYVLKNGITGSAMVKFDQLSDKQKAEVAKYIYTTFMKK